MTTTTLNIPIDAAAARLRSAGHAVEKQGMHWRVRPPGGEFAIATADELRALAVALPETVEPTETTPPQQWGPQSLPIRRIRRDGGTQARVGLNEDVVQEYAEAMRDERWDWATIKRPLVYTDGESGDYWLADGFHRIEAAQRANLTDYRVEILRGDKRAAQLHAARANADHGLRRSRQDIQRAIELLLRDAEWAGWSDREIARHVHCAHVTVGAVRRQLESTGQLVQSTERTTRDGRTMQTAGIAAANQARGAINRPDGSPAPVAAPGALRCSDCHTTEGVTAREGSITGIALCDPCRDKRGVPTTRGLSEAAIADGWTLRKSAGQWEATQNGVFRGWHRTHEDAAQAVNDRFSATPPALAPDVVQHRAVVAALNDMEARGWTVFRVTGDTYRLTIGPDQYETSGAGVVTASLLLAARAFESPDALMEAVNAIRDEAPVEPATDAPFWQSMSEHHPTAHHWTRTGAYSYRAACGMTAQRAPSGRTDAGQCSSCARALAASVVAPAPAPSPTTTAKDCQGGCGGPWGAPGSQLLDGRRLCPVCASAAAGRTCECGKMAIAQRNIGGISAWRCQDCATREEIDDLQEQLGDQYLGFHYMAALVGSFHNIAWAGGGGGAYTYDDALTELHSSARQLRLKAAAPPEPPRDPRAAAVAWRSRMQTLLATANPMAMYARSEMLAAVTHVDALLTTRAADALATIAAIEARVVEAETWLGHDLSAPHLPEVLRQCRRQLDGLADDPAVSTTDFDALSARLGDAQAQLIESVAI